MNRLLLFLLPPNERNHRFSAVPRPWLSRVGQVDERRYTFESEVPEAKKTAVRTRTETQREMYSEFHS